MVYSPDRRTIKLTSLVVFVAFFFLSAATVSAVEDPAEAEKEKPTAAEPTSKEKADGPETSHPNISYILFANAMKVESSPENRPRYVTPEKYAEALGSKEAAGQNSQIQNRNRVATAPLSVGEKFDIFVKGSFYFPGPLIQPLFSGSLQELFDNDENKKDTFGNYVADTFSRAARSYAFGTTARFFQDFALPSLFKQDPRYHRKGGRHSTGERIKHAVSRVFVTRGDNGNDQFNASFLLGGAITAGISNVWEREENKTVGRSFRRWGFNIGFSALGNIAAEFLGGQ